MTGSFNFPPPIVNITITRMWSRKARLVNNFLDRTEFGLGNSKGTYRPGRPLIIVFVIPILPLHAQALSWSSRHCEEDKRWEGRKSAEPHHAGQKNR
jgi:hypothetical protein